MNDRTGCILMKFIGLITVVTGILFTPFQVLYCFPVNNTKLDWINISSILFISVVIIIFGLIEIIKTNNPVSRFNPFTINPKWRNKMDKSVSEDPSQLFNFDSPTKEDLRNSKIDKIIK